VLGADALESRSFHARSFAPLVRPCRFAAGGAAAAARPPA